MISAVVNITLSDAGISLIIGAGVVLSPACGRLFLPGIADGITDAGVGFCRGRQAALPTR